MPTIRNDRVAVAMRELFMRYLMERLLNREAVRQIHYIHEAYIPDKLAYRVRVQFKNGHTSPELMIDDDPNLSVIDIDTHEAAIRAWPGFGEWQAHCFMVTD